MTGRGRGKGAVAARDVSPAAPSGLTARALATDLVAAVLQKGRTLDEAIADLTGRADYRMLPAKDRALARLIAATVLRRQGRLEAILAGFIERPLPRKHGLIMPVLLVGAAQLVFLGIAPHAVVSIAVDQVRRDARAQRYAGLANAVLRRVAERGAEIAAAQDPVRLDIPDWLWKRWAVAYGDATARRIAEASLMEAPLDISVKTDPEGWSRRLGGHLLPTGTIRLAPDGRVEDLPGFAEGAWWVQDAAAALPALLLGEVEGRHVADLCAAPGGKTAELAARGAHVTAVDISGPRLARLKANLARLGLAANLVEADAAQWEPAASFDAVLLDAPCTSTGTIRRHPDILRLKRPGDLTKLCELQARLLDNARRIVRPGGLIVYSTCSLEPEEGEHQVERLLTAGSGLERVPVRAGVIGAEPDWVTPSGDLRTFPFHMPLVGERLSGLDGFFAARLRRASL